MHFSPIPLNSYCRMPETKIFNGKKSLDKKRSEKKRTYNKNGNNKDKDAAKLVRNRNKSSVTKKRNARSNIFNTRELPTPNGSDTANNSPSQSYEKGEAPIKKVNRKKREKRSRSEVMNSFDHYDHLIVANSKIHGKGIFTPVQIKEKTLIMEYKGEIIGKLVSDKREKFYIKNNFDSIYMFTVSDDMIIDATMTGNKARYINHSCDPNCEAINCIRDKSIKYCSVRDIKANEELTINYNMPLKENEKCGCGAENCIARLNLNED